MELKYGETPGDLQGVYPQRHESDRICNRCRQLEIDVAFTMDVPQQFEVRRFKEIGELDDICDDSLCGTCRFLAIMRPPTMGPYDLVMYSSRRIECSTEKRDNLRRFNDTTLLAVVQRPATQNDNILQHISKTGSISEACRDNELGLTIFGWPVQFRTANFELVNTWLTFCREHHHERCILTNPKALPELGLRLIDCHSKRLIHAQLDAVYMALSYVWGPNLDTGTKRTPDNELPDDVPPVIIDAIEATKKLGCRYLWVDRYCIPQDDQLQKRMQIKHMGSIYQNAQATIVAAAGVDPSFGLPGVGFRHKNRQPEVTFNGIVLRSTLPNPKYAVQRSKWMTRGWTFQEALMSRRLVIFTEDQVYFECNTMYCSEAMRLPLEACHTEDKKLLCVDFAPGLFSYSAIRNSCWDIQNTIEAYCKRALTYDDDILDALQSVFLKFENSDFPVHQFYGVPIYPSVQWHPTAMTVQGSKLHGFRNAMLWKHYTPARRRRPFPSWSWAGWDGDLSTDPNQGFGERHPQYQGCSCDPDVVSISVGSTSGMISWSVFLRMIESGEPLHNLTGVLQVTAWTVKLRLEYFPQGFQIGQTPNYSPSGYYLKASLAQVNTKNGILHHCTHYRRVSLSKPLMARCGRSILEKEFLGVILDCQLQQALVVDINEGIGERIGVLDIGWFGYTQGWRANEAESRNLTQLVTVVNQLDSFLAVGFQRTYQTVQIR